MRNGKRLPHLLIGLLCALVGAVCLCLFWFIKETHKDYSRRWLVLLLAVLLLVAGFQFLKEQFRRDLSSELDELLNSIARTIMYGGFGVLTMSGVFRRDSKIGGGLPFVPDGVNTGIGRALFAVIGIALCGIGLYCLVLTFASLRKYLASKSA